MIMVNLLRKKLFVNFQKLNYNISDIVFDSLMVKIAQKMMEALHLS